MIQAGRRFPGGTVFDKTISHIEHARRFRRLLAEGHLTRLLFASMVRRTEALSAMIG